jgi:outer membrane protein
MKDFLRIFNPEITFQIPPYPPFLKGGWGDYLIFKKSHVSQMLVRIVRLMTRLTQIFLLILAVFFSDHCYAEDTSEMLTLSDGLRLATANNRLIKIASITKDIASADTYAARSGLLPNINASLNQTFLAHQPGARFGSQKAFLAEKDSLSYGIDIYHTIYDFGANVSRYKASKTVLDVTKLDMMRIKNLVALDFINAYFDLLETEKMVLVAQTETERFESHLKVAQSLYDEGVITKSDLLQAEVMLSDAKQRLVTMKNRRSFNSSNINNILARPLSTTLQVVDVPTGNPEVVGLEKAWDTAGKERSEIKIIDNQLRVLDFQETAAKSGYYPTLFAQGGYNYTENCYEFPSENWSLILGVNLNVFSGGSTKAGVSKVLYQKQQLFEQKRKLIDDIKLEVEKNYLDLKNASEKIQVTKDAVGQAEENLRINEVRYEEGVGTSTDVVDAITLLTTTETNYYRAVYELQRARAGLQYATGLDLVSIYSY